jgi:glycine dehydrogenase subunit 1
VCAAAGVGRRRLAILDLVVAYLPNGDAERQAMLERIGARSIDELFDAIPAPLRSPELDLPVPLSEQELVAEVGALAAENRSLTQYDSFLGAGVYHRFSPAIVRATVSRPEFFTAYTPYQAEASQGTLQTIFEFQSMICALTGLDVANASLYDGATACAEALMLAVGATSRRRLAVCADVHPETISVVRTFAEGRRVAVDIVDPDAPEVGDTHAALLVAQPSFLGTVRDIAPLAERAHRAGALAVCSIDLFAATLLPAPGAAGFDIAVGDGQPLGIPLSFGGPHVGFMATTTALMRRIPGRLVGMTTDTRGRRAFTLTLQTREQHIRREKATSNICTNHALIALAATVYMAHMGFGGMRRVAEVSVQRAHHLAARLAAVSGFSRVDERPFLWEFRVRVPGGDARHTAAQLRQAGIVGGLPLGRHFPGGADELLVCCTEMTSAQAIDRYVEAASRIATADGVGASA